MLLLSICSLKNVHKARVFEGKRIQFSLVHLPAGHITVTSSPGNITFPFSRCPVSAEYITSFFRYRHHLLTQSQPWFKLFTMTS